MADETVFDAINTALNEVTPGAGDAPDPKDPPVADPPANEPATAEDPPENDDVELESDEDPEAGAESTEDGGESKPAGKEPAGKPVEPVAKPAIVESDADKAKREATELDAKRAAAIDAPVPRELKAETQERIRTLISMTKEVTANRDEMRKNIDFLVQGVQSTGTTPEQYGETLSWLSLFNSPNPEHQAKALDLLEDVADRLAGLLGRERRASDPLAAFPELVAAVRSGQMTREWAAKLALSQRQQQSRQEISTQRSQTQEQQAARERETETARVAMNDWETEIAKIDPQWEAKKAMIVPMLQPLFKDIPPSQWLPKFQEAYSRTKIANAGRALRSVRSTTPGVPPNQPLRAKQPAGGGAKQPSSMLEALEAGLSQVRR